MTRIKNTIFLHYIGSSLQLPYLKVHQKRCIALSPESSISNTDSSPQPLGRVAASLPSQQPLPFVSLDFWILCSINGKWKRDAEYKLAIMASCLLHFLLQSAPQFKGSLSLSLFQCDQKKSPNVYKSCLK